MTTNVEYVGISRALDSRCSSHPATRRGSLETLNPPPLYRSQATSVEEAPIGHFGSAFELPTDPAQARLGLLGQLQNTIQAISSLRPDYCARLLLGQTILDLNGYGRDTVAFFTRGRHCLALR